MKSIKYIGGWNYDNLGDRFIKEGFRKLFRSFIVSDAFMRPSLSALVGGTANPGWVLQLYKDIEAGIPAFIFGTGIADTYTINKGGIEKTTVFSNTINYWQSILSNAIYVGVRTPGAAKILGSYWAGKIEVIGDPAINCCSPKVRDGDSKRIGISLHTNWQCYGNQEFVDREMSILVRKLLKSGYEVELFPCEHISATNSDTVHNLNFIKQYGLSGVRIHKNYRNISSTICKISSCKLFIGERLHPIIIASASGVPVISLSYHDKCLDFMDSVGFGKFAVRTDDLSVDKLFSLIDDINLNYKNYSERLVEVTLRFQRLQKEASEKIIDSFGPVKNGSFLSAQLISVCNQLMHLKTFIYSFYLKIKNRISSFFRLFTA